MILQPSSFLPDVPRREAPWELRGDAYAVFLKLPRDARALRDDLPPSLAGRPIRGVSTLLFVDYRSSNCGPYHEIMLIPGSLPFGDRWCASIGRIYVSTFDSVVNGRLNWGIPKDRANFDVRYGIGPKREDDVRVSYQGRELAELRLSAPRLGLPVTTKVVPQGLRTVAQHWEGSTYFTAPTVTGTITPARVLGMRFDAELFPDVASARVLGAARLRDFRMTFPVANVARELL